MRTPRERFERTKLYGDVLEFIDACSRDHNEANANDYDLAERFVEGKLDDANDEAEIARREGDLRDVLALLLRTHRIVADALDGDTNGMHEYQTVPEADYDNGGN